MNFTLVGAFVLLLGAALIAGVLWLASGGSLQKRYDMYLAVEDESVAGLNLNAPVKYNGVDVGKVASIQLDPGNPELVRLLFAIERGTPVKTDTEAVLKTQGLTGIAYVELAGGSRDAAPLRASGHEAYPQIRTKASLSARLENVLTNVLSKLDSTSNNVNAFLSDTNRQAVSSALADIAAVSRTLAARKGTIDSGLSSAARTFGNAERLSAQLGPVLAQLAPAVAQLAPALERVSQGADSVQKMGTEVALAGAAAGTAVVSVSAELQRFSAQTLPELQRLLGEMNDLSNSLRRLSEQTERNPSALLFGRTSLPNGPGETTPAVPLR